MKEAYAYRGNVKSIKGLRGLRFGFQKAAFFLPLRALRD